MKNHYKVLTSRCQTISSDHYKPAQLATCKAIVTNSNTVMTLLVRVFAFSALAELVVVRRSPPLTVVLGDCGGGEGGGGGVPVGLTDITDVGVAVGVGLLGIIWTGVADTGGDSLEGILRLVRSAGPKHDASSLKASREQFRNVGHVRLASEVRVGSHADLTNLHRPLHVFTLVGILVDGSVKHSGK